MSKLKKAVIATASALTVSLIAGATLYKNINTEMYADDATWTEKEITNTQENLQFPEDTHVFFNSYYFINFLGNKTRDDYTQNSEGELVDFDGGNGFLLEKYDANGTLIGTTTSTNESLDEWNWNPNGTGLSGSHREGYTLDIPWIYKHGEDNAQILEPYYYRIASGKNLNPNVSYDESINASGELGFDAKDEFVAYCIDFGKIQPSKTNNFYSGITRNAVPLIKAMSGLSVGFVDTTLGDQAYTQMYYSKEDLAKNTNSNPNYQVYVNSQNSLRMMGVFMNGYPSRTDIGENEFGLTNPEQEWCTNIALKIASAVNYSSYQLTPPLEIEVGPPINDATYKYLVQYYMYPVLGIRYSQIINNSGSTYHQDFELSQSPYFQKHDKVGLFFKTISASDINKAGTVSKYVIKYGEDFEGFDDEKINKYIQYIYYLTKAAEEIETDIVTNYNDVSKLPETSDFSFATDTVTRNLTLKEGEPTSIVSKESIKGPFKLNIRQGMYSSDGLTMDTRTFISEGDFSATASALVDTLTLTVPENYVILDKNGTEKTLEDGKYEISTDEIFYVKKLTEVTSPSSITIDVSSTNVVNIENVYYWEDMEYYKDDYSQNANLIQEPGFSSSTYQSMFPIITKRVKGSFSVDFEAETYEFQIEKRDKNNDNILVPGTKFSVTTNSDITYLNTSYSAGSVIAELTTNEQGTASLDKLPSGTYTVKEISVPKPYILNENENENTQTVKIPSDDDTIPVLTFRNEKVGSFIIKKYDGNNVEKSLSATFYVYKDAVNGEVCFDGKPLPYDAERKCYYAENLPFGTYYVVEDSAQKYYFKDDTPKKIVIDDNSTQTEIVVDFPNYPLGAATIVKVDADNEDITLSGAKFNIYESDKTTLVKDEDNNIIELITNETGMVETPLLKPGTYYLKEIQAPVNYQINEDLFEMKIVSADFDDAGEIVISQVYKIPNTPVKGKIQVIKTDANDSTKKLSGAVFGIYSDSSATVPVVVNNKNLTITTNEKGEAETPSTLSLGTYYIKELTPPDDYILNNTIYDITLAQDANDKTQTVITQTIEIPNTPIKGKIQILKYNDENKDEKLAGAEFSLLDFQKNPVKINNQDVVLITDTDGFVETPELPLGVYYVREIKAPDGYLINNTIFKIVLAKTNDTTNTVLQTITVPDRPTEVVLKKQDLTTSEAIPGAKIEIYDANNNVVISGTTDKNGNLEIKNLPVGKYTFREIAAPAGYSINETIFSFEIKEDGTVVGDNTITDKPTHVVITKRNLTTSETIPGAKIEIYDSNNKTVFSGITNSNGEVEVFYLPAEKYTFKEIVAPNGYIINETVFEFEIKENGEIIGDCTVNDKPTEVVITKKDVNTSESLPGAKIEIYDSNNKIVFSGTTDSKGEIKAFYLPVGKYTFKETVAPKGYTINTSIFSFEIKENGEIIGDCTVTDKKEEKSFVIKKKDFTTSEGVPGAEIRIYDSDKNLVFKGVSDKYGEIEVEMLPEGTYTFKETVAPEGYTLNETIFKFKIDSEGNIKGDNTITDKPTHVVITKKDLTTSETIPGAKIEIYDSNNKTVFSGITDSNGKVEAFYLPIGTYTFREVVAPNGYILNETIFSFEIKENGEIIGDCTITDKPTHVVITKKDLTTSETVPGAKIEIYDFNNKTVFSGVTDSKGEIETFYLPVGKYIFKEVVAPKGYVLNETIFSFEIKENGKIIGDCTITDKPTHVVITKKDLTTSETIPGAKIEIYDFNNKTVFSGVTDSKGEIEAFYLPVGKYTFKETVAPKGYTLNETIFSFEIKENGDIVGDCTVTDKPTEVVITKKDFNTSESLPGAKIEVYDNLGNLVFNDITDENGEIRKFYLPVGTYTFRETVAPSGYNINKSEMQFTIHENGDITGDTIIYDTPIIKTGVESKNTHNYGMYAIVLGTVLTILGLFITKNKTNKK